MDVLESLSDFFAAIEKDPRISVTHIGIYAALLQYWRMHGCANPVQAFSHQIMRIAKVSAPATYHKCVRDLDAFGYIRYEPSFKRNQGSRIFLLENEENVTITEAQPDDTKRSDKQDRGVA